MKLSRRKFIPALGASLIIPTALLAQEERKRRSRWDMIFNGDLVQPAPHKPDPSKWSDAAITAAWLGHSTVLINFFGTNIITDPVLSQRVGINILGWFTAGPKRLVEPALTIDELPRIDLILLSHAHMDHLDLMTLRKLDQDIPVVMAKNTLDIIEHLEFAQVNELDWGEGLALQGIEIEALKVKHFGWRYPWEEDRSRGNMDGRSFNGYLLSKNGHNVVFGGDTAYTNYFSELAKREITVDLAIMPIGCYDPWIFNHANPEQAHDMAAQMKAKFFIPIHWGTFIQSDEPTSEPIQRLKKTDGNPRVVLDAIGQTWSMETSLVETRTSENIEFEH